MANYATLKAAIQDVIKTNGNNEITGALLQQSLLAMINSLGVGYQFMGVATPETNPGTPDQNIFYLAGSGMYVNFGNIIISKNKIGVLMWDGAWESRTIPISSTFSGNVGFSASNATITPASLPQYDSQMGTVTLFNGASSYLWVCMENDGFSIESNGVEIPMTFIGVFNQLYCYVSDEKINQGVIKFNIIYKGVAKSEDERLTITARSYTIEYGDTIPELSFFANGEVEGTPIISCEATSQSGVGTYLIHIERGTVTDDNAIYVDGYLTIEKAELTITANDVQVQVGAAMPTFSVTYSGFKNDEDETVLTTLPTCTTDAQNTDTEGVFTITPAGAVAANYSFNYIPGNLIVGDPTIIAWTSSEIFNCTRINGYIDTSTNVWKTSNVYRGVLIDVRGYQGCKVRFTRSASWTGVRYAFLRSFGNATITNNQTIAFSQVAGYTTQITNSTDTEFDVVIPSDAVYMYVYSYSSGTNTAPGIAIKGVGPNSKAVNLVSSLFTANKTIGTDGTVYTGSDAPNNWTTTTVQFVHDVSYKWQLSQILNSLPSGFSDIYIGIGEYSAAKQWIRRVGYSEIPDDFTLTADVCFVHIIMYGHDANGNAIAISSVPIDGDEIQVIGTEI